MSPTPLSTVLRAAAGCIAPLALALSAVALPAQGPPDEGPPEEAPAGTPAAPTIDEVVADYLFDLDNGFRNAAHEHGRIGSGHFEDIVEVDWLGPDFGLLGKVYSGDDWPAEIVRIEAILNASPHFQGEGWSRSDGHLGTGETYRLTRPDGTSRSVSLGYVQRAGAGFVGIHIRGEVADYGRDALFLADIPKEPGGTSSLMRRLASDAGRAAFQELLVAAKDDFEPILTFGEDGALGVEPSLLNPGDSPLTFLRLEDYPERRELHFYPAAGAEEGMHHLLAILVDLGYSEVFGSEDWRRVNDGSYAGIGDYAHVELAAVADPGSRGSHWVLGSIKKDMRALHERMRLVPSGTHPKVAALLGCASGDCNDGFGELRYLDPEDHDVIRAHRGWFRDGRFHGPGANYEIGHREWIVDFDRHFEPDDIAPEYIGHFRNGAPVTVHMPLTWMKDRELCELLHGYRDCELWSGSLDAFDAEHDRYSIAVFAVREGEADAARHAFLQHRTFEDGRTVVIDRPFTVDFGVPVRGTCRGEEGALELPGIGLLEARFDAAGVAQDRAYLTLLSGEIYEVRIQNGIPVDFERVAVPEGLSWKVHARSGAWAMLQANTCLEGDCRAVKRPGGGAKLDVGDAPFVWSAVRTRDGAMKHTPGYLTVRAPDAGSTDPRTSFTAYYHRGVEFEKAKRRKDPNYRLTQEDAWHYDVRYAHIDLHLENEFFGSLDGSYRLQGEYTYDQLNSPHYTSLTTAYFKDDVRYLFDYETRVDSLGDPTDNIEIEEANDAKREELAAEERRRREAERAASAQRREGPRFGAAGPQHIAAMNSIFARPAPEPRRAAASTCTCCGGLGVVSEPHRRTVRKFEETTLFFRSWNETEVYYEFVTCRPCFGSGKR